MTFNEIASFCEFEDRINDSGESVSILLPNEIKLVNAPIPKDLFASDKNFVCRSFTANVIEGRYTFEELKQLAMAGRKVRSIDGRELALSTYEGPRRQRSQTQRSHVGRRVVWRDKQDIKSPDVVSFCEVYHRPEECLFSLRAIIPSGAENYNRDCYLKCDNHVTPTSTPKLTSR